MSFDASKVVINGKTKYLVYGVYCDTPEEAQADSDVLRKQLELLVVNRDEIDGLRQRVKALESELARYREQKKEPDVCVLCRGPRVAECGRDPRCLVCILEERSAIDCG